MIDSRACALLVASGALALQAGIFVNAANAATVETARAELRARLADCGHQPPSLVDACKSAAMVAYNQSVAPVASTQQQRAAVAAAEQRYRDDQAACARLLPSLRDICSTQAAGVYFSGSTAAMRPASVEHGTMTEQQIMQRYQTAIAACGHLPSSEREICAANAGLAGAT
jgi:hypothetical protein